MYLPSRICKLIDEGAEFTLGNSPRDGIRFRARLNTSAPGNDSFVGKGHTKEEAIAKLETALHNAEKQT